MGELAAAVCSALKQHDLETAMAEERSRLVGGGPRLARRLGLRAAEHARAVRDLMRIPRLWLRPTLTVIAVALASAGRNVLAADNPSTWWRNEYVDLKPPIAVSLVVLSILVFLLIRMARANPNLYLRPLAGIKAIEEAVGRATEMGRPVIYIPGVDDVNNIQTIYSMVILGKVAEMVAKYGTPLLVPTCSAFVTPMAEETVKQGYLNAGVPDAYNPRNIRYLSNEQFAFTAATNGMILRERPAASLLMGSFYAESLLMAETGFQAGSIQVAGTANIHQLPFFVVACDYTLIGEEFYAATAYLSREPGLLGTIKAQDYFKVGILAVLTVGTILATLSINFSLGESWNAIAGWLSF